MENVLASITVIIVLGISAQWIAWRIRLPSILLLLVCGFVAGPVLGWVNPDHLLGDLLMPLVSISVGLILFEGGLTLKFSELKTTGKVVRNLITIGALVTWVLTTIAARVIFDWDWPLATLLGAVLVVTGPTVIMPLLRHIQPNKQIASTLKWEGILIDPVGALLALLVFEAIVSHGDESVSLIALSGLGKTILIGGTLGLLAGYLLTFCFKHYWIPDYLQNPVSLMMVVCVFTTSNLFQHESGLLTVTIMGIMLANQKSVQIRHIVEFKENLRVLLISGLFVLLAARLNLETIRQLNPIAGLTFLLVIMLVVRPVAVFASSVGSRLKLKERLFLSWMAPRGIVAAAVASIFSLRLAEADHPHALELVPATFLVIVGTVAIYGLTSGPLAKWMGLSKPNPQGILFLGANPLARTLAKVLQDEGVQVLMADTNRQNAAAARLEGLPVYFGNVLAEHARDNLELSGIGKLLAITPNHETNTLAALHCIESFGRREVYQVQVHTEAEKIKKSEAHGRMLFGKDILLKDLNEKLTRGAVVRKTKLTDEFNFENWKAHHGQDTVPLFLLTEAGLVRLFTSENPPNPTPGNVILALGQPPAEKIVDTPHADENENAVKTEKD